MEPCVIFTVIQALVTDDGRRVVIEAWFWPVSLPRPLRAVVECDRPARPDRRFGLGDLVWREPHQPNILHWIPARKADKEGALSVPLVLRGEVTVVSD